MTRSKRKAVTDEVSNDEVKPRAKPRSRKKQAVTKTNKTAVKALIRKNAATSPLLLMPSEVRENILTHLVGGNLLHLKYLDGVELYHANRAKSDELRGGASEDTKSEEPFGYDWFDSDDDDDGVIAIPETGFDPAFAGLAVRKQRLQPGLRHAICVANKSELSAYEEAISGHVVVPEGEMAEYYIASCKQRHADCKMCGSGPMFLSEADRQAFRVDLNVLGVCRQLYEEANHLLWTTNTFSFEDPKTFEKFFGSLNPAQKRNLTSVHIGVDIGTPASWYESAYHRARWDSNYWGRALKMSNLKMLRGVQALHLSVYQAFDCVQFGLDNDEVAIQIEIAQKADMEFILRLRALSVKNVTVIVSDDAKKLEANGKSTHRWTALKKNEYAESIRVKLVDPSGAELVKTEVEAAILSRNIELRDKAAAKVKTYKRILKDKQAGAVQSAGWARRVETRAELAAQKADRMWRKGSKKAAKLQLDAEKQKAKVATARAVVKGAVEQETRWQEHVAYAREKYRRAMARLGERPEELEDEEEADKLMEGLNESDMDLEEDDVSQVRSNVQSGALVSTSDETSSNEEDECPTDSSMT